MFSWMWSTFHNFDMAGKQVTKMEINVCLLCYQTYKPNVQNGEIKANIINEQLFVVFLLRNALEIPKSFCETLLTTKGNPSQWIFCCSSCSTIIQDLHKVFLELTTIQKKYDSLKQKVKLILENSNDSTACYNEKIPLNQIGSADEIRQFIFSEQNDNGPSQVQQDVTINDSKQIDNIIDANENLIKEEIVQMEMEDGEDFPQEFGDDYLTEKKFIAEDSVSWSSIESDNCNWNSDSDCESEKDNEAYIKKTKRQQPCLNDIISKPEIKISEGKRRNCSFCEKSFKSLCQLKDHENIHTGVKPFECSVCKKAFIQKSDLRKHMRIHTGDKPFGCSECAKTFVQKSDLRKHIMWVHTGVKPFECSKCKQCFARKGSLSHHMKLHAEKKPFGCSAECGKADTEKNYLAQQMKTYMAKKPFKCTI